MANSGTVDAGVCHNPSEFYNLIQSSRVARMSCERATVKAMSDKLVTYKDLRNGLIATREEFERANEWDDKVNAGYMALRWTKAACDAFISMAASASSIVLPKNAAGAVKGLYTISTAVAEAGASSHAGGKVDKAVLLRDVKDGVIDIAGESMGKASGVVNLYVNITIDAVRGDQSAVVTHGTAGQLSETAKLAAEWAKELDKAGANQLASGFAAVVDIASAGVKFGDELDKAADDYFKTSDEMNARRSSLRLALLAQLKRIEFRIAELESTLDACVVPAST